MTPRYTLTTHIGLETERLDTDSLADAQDKLTAFRLANQFDKDAQAGLWDRDVMRYVGEFWGGQKAGPIDRRHPLEIIFSKAVAAGHRVTVVAPMPAQQQPERIAA